MFGGNAVTTAVPHAAACLLLLVIARPHLSWRVDRGLLLVLAVIALQIVSLPAALTNMLSPHAWRLNDGLALAPRDMPALLPLSIESSSTRWALAVAAGASAIFWIARGELGKGGVRMAVRTITGLGFILSLLAIAQAATAGRRIYWTFPTEIEGPLPFGPFVNRNHFATWAVMAMPLCFGYLVARMGGRPEPGKHVSKRARLAHAIDPRAAWLLAAGGTMLVALLLSLSRSGILALGVSSVATLILARHRIERPRRGALLASIAVVAIMGLAWADLPALRARAAGAESGLANRLTIWRETMPVVADFWVAGTGAGTYQRAMFAYQRSSRTVYFNQAHNHYLQVVAEGGLLLSGIVLFAFAAFAAAARRSIVGDATGLAWIRIGAACGLGAVALQSVWETGLVLPANAALAAVLAAIVVHERREGEGR
jgi:hypothetical protein